MSSIEIFREGTIRSIVGEEVDLRTSLSDVNKLVSAVGGILDTEKQTSLDNEGIESLRELFTLSDTADNIIVLHEVGHFGVRLNSGFESNLDGWGNQTLVIHRASSESIRIAVFFNNDRVELYWLPRLSDEQVSIRQIDSTTLVVDLRQTDGKLVGGLGFERFLPTSSVLTYERDSGASEQSNPRDRQVGA